MPFLLTSIVIPARNEALNLDLLVREIADAMTPRRFEIIIVDDGSTDATGETIRALILAGLPVRHLRHDRPAGQSAAIRTGVHAASGDLLVTIDGDGQNDPRYILPLIDALEAAGARAGLAAGQRRGRTDTALKRLSSRIANALRTAVLKDATRDTGCGLKAIPTAVLRRLPYFDGWHRYLPALVMTEGFQVVHLDVIDRERRFGQSNYGILDRAARGALDLLGVWWLARRRRIRPAVCEITMESAYERAA